MLSDRRQIVLRALIEEYIARALPCRVAYAS